MVREPESVEESLARNFWEESSGRAGNWEGRMRGVPKAASAGEWLESSLGVHRKARRKKGRWETQSEEAQRAMRVALRQRWVLSIMPLYWGWKAVVWMWEIWRRVVREDQREEVNWDLCLRLGCEECQNGKSMRKEKLLPMRTRKWRKGALLQANGWFCRSL
jgi:hypothetical protein